MPEDAVERGPLLLLYEPQAGEFATINVTHNAFTANSAQRGGRNRIPSGLLPKLAGLEGIAKGLLGTSSVALHQHAAVALGPAAKVARYGFDPQGAHQAVSTSRLGHESVCSNLPSSNVSDHSRINLAATACNSLSIQDLLP
jgi:hypothetical protein